ncbi:hypothetical protein ACROYT_G013794 [Oculina patagonica]
MLVNTSHFLMENLPCRYQRKFLEVENPKVKMQGEWKVLKEIFVGELQPDETVDAMREARLLSNLNHPNIVKFLDSFMDGEFFCIVTEYCEGGDLDDKITAWKKAGKRFDESLILAWFIQLVLAVKFMHEKRMLHRDLKTRNIFLKKNIIKLGDFGISRILMGTSDMATTFTGTPYYMSPEVLKHEGYKYKSDIWSMGAVLYELCNLQHAFQGESLMGVMYKIVEGNPPKLSDKYSVELQTLYDRMLDKDPANRPSASEVLRNEYIAQNLAKLKHQMDDNKLSFSVESHKQGNSRQLIEPRGGSLYQEPEGRPMTPMDKMKLRKQQKADEEAERIRRFTAAQVAENQERYSSHKKNQNRVSLPWVEEHPDVFNDAAFTITATDSLDFTPPTSPLTAVPVVSRDNRDDEQCAAAEASLSLTDVSEIPDDAELAETFYSQFEDEFEHDESDEEIDDEDDFRVTDTWRHKRIEGLRAECEKLLGREAFRRAYSYLKQVRFADELKSEDSILDGLAKIVDKPGDCFIVDQLLFMEKQAEIAAMT